MEYRKLRETLGFSTNTCIIVDEYKIGEEKISTSIDNNVNDFEKKVVIQEKQTISGDLEYSILSPIGNYKFFKTQGANGKEQRLLILRSADGDYTFVDLRNGITFGTDIWTSNWEILEEKDSEKIDVLVKDGDKVGLFGTRIFHDNPNHPYRYQIPCEYDKIKCAQYSIFESNLAYYYLYKDGLVGLEFIKVEVDHIPTQAFYEASEGFFKHFGWKPDADKMYEVASPEVVERLFRINHTVKHITIPCEYEDIILPINGTSNGYILVKQDGKWGFLDVKKNNLVISCEMVVDEITDVFASTNELGKMEFVLEGYVDGILHKYVNGYPEIINHTGEKVMKKNFSFQPN